MPQVCASRDFPVRADEKVLVDGGGIQAGYSNSTVFEYFLGKLRIVAGVRRVGSLSVGIPMRHAADGASA